MAISVSVKKSKGIEYVYICETFRDPQTRRPTSRILRAFGRKDKLLAENPDAMTLVEEEARKLREATEPSRPSLEERLGLLEADARRTSRVSSARPVAASILPAPYFRLWTALGLSDVFASDREKETTPFDANAALLLAVLDRIVDVAFFPDMRPRLSGGTLLFDFGDVRLDALDDILGPWAEKDRVVRKLNAERESGELSAATVVFYDLTALEVGEVTAYDRENCAALALLIDVEGVPVDYDIVRVDAKNVRARRAAAERFADRFGIDRKHLTVHAEDDLRMLAVVRALASAAQTSEEVRGQFFLNFLALLLERRLARDLLRAGVRTSSANFVRALESVRVSLAPGVLRNGEPLFFCNGNRDVADVTIEGHRTTMPLGRLCDRILEVCGLEPLSGLETEASLRRKLQMPFPLSKTVTREP